MSQEMSAALEENQARIAAQPLPGTVMPTEPELIEAAETRSAVASQWQLMRWRFKKHRLAVLSLYIIGIFYGIAVLGEFLAPADPDATNERYKYVSPQGIHFREGNGQWHLRPGLFALTGTRNPETLRLSYKEDPSQWQPLSLFVHGEPYKFWGIWPSDVHLFGIQTGIGDKLPFYLLGTDRLGRDMLSRLIYGTRISLSIGLVSVFLSLVLGIVLGGLSGFYGGRVDTLIQRIIEFVRSLPTIPLWLGLAAALPPGWSPLQVYFIITLILSLVGWTGLARVVRGRFLALREEDFVLAARFSGASEGRIIFRHMVPSMLSHIIASLTLAIPGVILAETSLSFLGLGLRPPIVSWGVLLQEAQNIQTVAISPWLLSPALTVVLIVFSFNFLGDGLRDAADPYGR